jgi:hypothetical protein
MNPGAINPWSGQVRMVLVRHLSVSGMCKRTPRGPHPRDEPAARHRQAERTAARAGLQASGPQGGPARARGPSAAEAVRSGQVPGLAGESDSAVRVT